MPQNPHRAGHPPAGPPPANTILIITEKFDPHADQVIRILNARAVPFFRLNTDDLHTEYRLTAASADGAITLADIWGRTHRFPDETRAVWHRKPIDPAPPPGLAETDPETHAEALRIIAQETAEFLAYPAASGLVPWVNNPTDNLRARRKFPQLRLAAELGLRVPRSLITNNPAQATEFHAEIGGRLLCKTMAAHGFRRGADSFFLFSRKIDTAGFTRHAAQVALCPTLLQEYIEKDHELRVTIFGDKVFACRIDSQSVAAAGTDWRQADPFTIPHRMVELDPTVTTALHRMLAHYNLRFGAFDLIVTPTGETVFLELNPNGQWLWMELITGAPMAEAMADLLLT